jgi:hypothetical protein
MMIDGVPKLACHTFLREFFPNKVRVDPSTTCRSARPRRIRRGLRADQEITRGSCRASRSIARGEHLTLAARQFRRSPAASIACCMVNPEFRPRLMALIHRYSANSATAPARSAWS